MIVNVASLAGRLAAGFIGQIFGVDNMTVISVGVCAAVTLAMVALKNIAGVVVIGVLFGFFWGLCESSTVTSLSRC